MLRACWRLLHYDRATATSVVLLALSQSSTVQSLFQRVSRTPLPFFDWDGILLLDSVPVPFRDYVERAERNYSLVWSDVVNVAAHQPFLVVVVLVLEVHHAQEHCLLVEVSQRFVIVLHERVE